MAIIVLVAGIIGLGAGYLLFSHSSIPSNMESHIHEASQATPTSTGDQTWTCSMHPQIRQTESGLCPICEMDLIPLEQNLSDDPLILQMTPEAVKLSNIQTTIIGGEKRQKGKTIQLSGKVQADERLASSQVAHVPGRIEKLYVSFTGEQVRKGQALANIYSPELITAQRELIEASKLKELNPQLLESARKKLRFWKVGDELINAVEQSGTIQETFTLRADQSGIVTQKRVAIGDYLKKGEPLFDLMSLDKVWVLFDAYEEHLAYLSVNDPIEFKTPSFPNKTFKARITFIDPFINPSTRVASLRAEVNNSSGLLKPEMFVNGSLQTKASSKTLLVIPKSAVLWTGKRSVVYVKVPDQVIPSFQFREVEIGESLGNEYQILSDLNTGEEVVTYGSFTIDAAAQLNNQASMMNKNVKVKAEQEVHSPDFKSETPAEFKEQLATLIQPYLNLKDDFVATDAEAAANSAKTLLAELDKVNMGLVKGEAHLYWMDQLKGLKAHGSKIASIKQIEEQRKQFGFLSEILIHSFEVFGVAGKTLFVQHCPMAFDNQGGDWLSDQEEIRNPYFGDKMLKCGLVKDTFPNHPAMH